MSGVRVAAFVLVGLLGGCTVRDLPAPVATYDEVEPVLRAACLDCHGEARAEGGYRIDSYLATVACPTGSTSAVLPADTTAPILTVLDQPDHSALLTAQEKALITEWVTTGAQARLGEMHPPGWVNPRSPDFHGTALAADGFRQMLDPDATGACARCHRGTTGTVDPEAPSAPGASDCTSCHREEGGPTACSTCHGSAGHAYPPRDLCVHPEEANKAGAHEKHTAAGITCEVCHGERRTVAMLGTSEHGNGTVDVHLDPARAGEGATYTPGVGGEAGTCTASKCHTVPDAGGTLLADPPHWLPDVVLTCGSCHGSPPPNHYSGTCNTCHREAAADGMSRIPGPLHMNGRFDVGDGVLLPDGSVPCGECHGAGEDPMPSTGSHVSHVRSSLSAPVACTNCHVMPPMPRDMTHPSRTRAQAEVVLGGLASARGATPVRNPDGSCAGVACHGAGLGGGVAQTPMWGDPSGTFARCGACHSVPPPPPHTTATNCSAISCHGGYVGPGPSLTTVGVAAHINGTVNLWTAP